MKPKIIFSDFDGTLTDGESLGSIFFEILNQCQRLQVPFVIVSGRALSWGHFLLTHLPLHYAIMEGGGVVLEKTAHDFNHFYLSRDEDLEKLQKVAREIVKRFEVSLTGDSLGRQTDRAIERGVLDGNPHKKKLIEEYLTAEGVNFSYSSVHLNFWCGSFSKATGAQYLLDRFYPAIRAQESLFFGDAPNDQSMFQWSGASVGVSNISSYLKELRHAPKTILQGNDNRGPYGVLNYLRSL